MKKKLNIIVLVFALTLSLMCPLTALGAETINIDVPFEEPAVTDVSGYVNFLMEHKTTKKKYVLTVSFVTKDPNVFATGLLQIPTDHSFQLTFSNSTAEPTIGFVRFWDDGSIFYGGDTKRQYRYSNNDYRILNYTIQASNVSYSDQGWIPTNPTPYVVNYGRGTQQHKLLYNLTVLLGQLLENNKTQLDRLNSIVNSVGDIKTKLDRVIYLIQDNNDLLGVILQQDKDFYAQNLIKLQQIIDILNSSGNTQDWSFDSSSADSFISEGSNIMQDNTADLEQAMNVNLNSNAIRIIWDITEALMQTDPHIMLLAITILSFGLIALILNR